MKLLPNTIDIQADDLLEATKVNRELLLKKKLRPVLRDFDIVIIDTPPAMRAATLNGLAVADTVLIPVDSSYFALLGPQSAFAGSFDFTKLTHELIQELEDEQEAAQRAVRQSQ